jgi:hypothetical protein
MNFTILIYLIVCSIFSNTFSFLHNSIINGGKYKEENIIINIEKKIKQDTNRDKKKYIFGLLSEINAINKLNAINSKLSLLSEKYNTTICLLVNKCDLYDNFTLRFNYTLHMLSSPQDCKKTFLYNQTSLYGPYYYNLYEGSNYSIIWIKF